MAENYNILSSNMFCKSHDKNNTHPHPSYLIHTFNVDRKEEFKYMYYTDLYNEDDNFFANTVSNKPIGKKDMSRDVQISLFETPDLNINDNTILYCYDKITSIDMFFDTLTKYVEMEKNKYTISRLIEIFIIINYDMLKKDNSLLIKAMNIAYNKNQHIPEFIETYLNNIDIINFNIHHDFYQFIKNN